MYKKPDLIVLAQSFEILAKYNHMNHSILISGDECNTITVDIDASCVEILDAEQLETLGWRVINNSYRLEIKND